MNPSGPLSPKQVHTLYQACGDSIAGRHDYALLVTMFNCGLTTSEISSLRWVHIDWSRGWLRIAESGQRPRFIPLNQRTAHALSDWHNHACRWPFVFGRWSKNTGLLIRLRARERQKVIEQRLALIAELTGNHFSADQVGMTLVYQLLNLSDEGRDILSLVPQNKWNDIKLPVAHMSPFSVANRHTGMALVAHGFTPSPADFQRPPPDDEVIRQGRLLLDKVGEIL